MMIVGVVGAIIMVVGSGWWLWHMNSGDIKDADRRAEENKKGAITEGLVDGKDYGTDYSDSETATFEALVMLRDQTASNPQEDAASSLKRGDVLAVRKRPHLWSDTERVSYLVVPIEMTGKEANRLLEPKKNGDRIVLARARNINLDRVGFTGNSVIDGQPVADKQFDTSVIMTK